MSRRAAQPEPVEPVENESAVADSRTVAAIDCGTNSIRLLVSMVLEEPEEPGGAGADTAGLVDMERRMEVVRLGQDVDRTGAFAPEALERTFAVLRDYAEVMTGNGVELGPDAVRMVATSATRDAANRQEFIDGVHGILGVEPEVVTGDEEAELSFVGATAELEAAELEAEERADGAGRAVQPLFPRPHLVVDIGGGSTEFVLGYGSAVHGDGDHGDGAGSAVRAARSVDIGCVRMTERHLRDDPPTLEQIAAAAADIDAALDEVAEHVALRDARTVVCVAGTATTVAGIALDLPEYDPERIHHTRVCADRMRAIREELLAMTREQRAGIGVMHPGRVDVIGAGALILDRVLARTGNSEFVASEHDILDGIAWSLALPAE